MSEESEQPLDAVDSEGATALRQRFAGRWIQRSEFPTAPLDDAADSLGLWVSPAETSGLQTLRATSHYTGGSWWLHDWDGDYMAAQEFIDCVADAAAASVKEQSGHAGQPVEWDRDLGVRERLPPSKGAGGA